MFSQPGDGLFAEESSKAPTRSRELGRGDNDENGDGDVDDLHVCLRT